MKIKRYVMMLKQKFLFATGVVLLLAGCSMREINLSECRKPNSKNVAYLVVDKNTDYSAKARVFVERVNDIELDLLNDPCVYVLESGTYTISFRTDDCRTEEDDSKHQQTVTVEVGKYYQILPTRNSGGVLSFIFSEIDKKKLTQINKRETKGAIDYIFYALKGGC